MSFYVRCKQVVSIPGPWRFAEFRSISTEDYSKAIEWRQAFLRICNQYLDEGKIISYDLAIETDGGACSE